MRFLFVLLLLLLLALFRNRLGSTWWKEKRVGGGGAWTGAWAPGWERHPVCSGFCARSDGPAPMQRQSKHSVLQFWGWQAQNGSHWAKVQRSARLFFLKAPGRICFLASSHFQRLRSCLGSWPLCPQSQQWLVSWHSTQAPTPLRLLFCFKYPGVSLGCRTIKSSWLGTWNPCHITCLQVPGTRTGTSLGGCCLAHTHAGLNSQRTSVLSPSMQFSDSP